MIRTRFAVVALALLALLPAHLRAQAQVSVNVGDSSHINVAPNAKFSVPVYVQPSGGAVIAALTTTFTWGQAIVTLDSIKAGALGWPVTPNLANALTGSASASTFDANGTSTKGSYALLWFTAPATTGGTHVNVTPTAAGNDIGTPILAQLVPRGMDICVAPAGKWGDVNGDTHVDIIDAQQIARFSVGLSAAAGVTTAGDVNADTHVDIIDAQQIARFSVGLSASARTNTTLFTPPTVGSVTLTPPSPTVSVGGTVLLTGTALDGASAPIVGCAPITYTSSDTTIAKVNGSGVVSGIANGSATITAASGGKSAQVTVTVGAVTGGSVASLELVDGADLATYAGVQTGQLVRVRAKNAGGGIVPGATVTFTIAGGNGLLGAVGSTLANGANTSPINATTDASGVAIALVWSTGATPNSTAYTAAATGATTVGFTLAGISGRLGASTCIGDFWSFRCWGDGTRGQLGNGGTASSLSPVPVTMTGITVGANTIQTQEGFGDHTCLTDNAGAAWCWGSNSAGQLGDSTYANRSVPTRVKTNLSFQALVAGAEHTCGLTTAGGQIWCWGYNWAGQLGDSTANNRRFAPVQVRAPGVVFTALTAGSNHTCGGTAAGVWYCWGLNTSGQLGDGTTTNRSLPVLVNAGAAYQQVDGGESHSCAITAAGVASCWGQQGNGALGNGQLGSSPVTAPVAVTGGHSFIYLYAGNARTCAIEGDFSVWCWGLNNQGQLGDSSTVTHADPTRNAFTGYALRMGGTTLGTNTQTTCGLTNTTQQVFCWGGNGSGTIGDGTSAGRLSPMLIARSGGIANAPAALTFLNPLTTANATANSTEPAPGAAVLLRDPFGTPIPGATITWTALSGAITFAGNVTTITSQTDANGIATSGVVNIGATIGIAKVQASINGTNPSNATGLVRSVLAVYVTPTPANYVKVAGDSTYYGLINQGFVTVPLKVKVTDASSVAVANTAVQFSLGASSGTLNNGSTPITVLTDANGIATLPAGAWVPNTAANAVSTMHAKDQNNVVDLVFTATASSAAGTSPLSACELSNAGAAYCWGVGTHGEIGNGANTQVTVPTLVSGGLTFAALGAGSSAHHCALVGTTAYCWGFNDAGQLGDGTVVNKNVPTLVLGGLAFSQIATSGSSTCALTTTNALYCWGWSGTAGFDGVGGEATRARIWKQPHLVNTGGVTFTKVSLADDAVCGITAAGAIYCRGSGSRGYNLDGTYDDRVTFTQATGGPWKDLSATYLGICAIDNADHVSCAGQDQNLGALGNGLFNPAGAQALLLPVNSALTFAKLSNYAFGSCAIRANGDLYCWGNNGFGQAGSGPQQSATLSPTLVPGISLSTVHAMAFRTVCGKATNGLLYCWGQGGNGQVGNGTTTSSIFSPVAVSNWPDGPAAGTAVSLTAVNGPTFSGVVGLAVPFLPVVSVKDRTGAAVAGVTVTFAQTAGSGSVGGTTVQTDASGNATLGSWTLGPALGAFNNVVTATVAGVPTVSFAYSGIAPPAAINIVGGNNQNVFDFFGSASPLWVQVLDGSSTPINNATITWTVTGGNGTLSSQFTTTNGGIVTGATSSVNGVSQNIWTPPVGVGTTYTVTAAVQGLAPVTFSLKRVAWSVSGASNPVAAACRLRAGIPYCMGANTFGAVGDGTNTNRLVPTAVLGGVSFTSIAHAPYGFHQCALTAAGAAYCWGRNDVGQLGDGTTVDKNQPTLVLGGIAFTQLAVGSHTTCGVTAGGATYCWGDTGWGFLGDGSIYQSRTAPALVATGGKLFTSVAVGTRHLCALDGSGQAWCWGENYAGQLGVGTNVNSGVPVATNTAARYTQITAGGDFICGVTTANAVNCWGSNGNGQLGVGNLTNQLAPATTGAFSTAQEVEAGEAHACARTTTNIWCWGFNGSGQVGDGFNTQRTAPVLAGGTGFTGATSLPAFSRSTSCAASATQLYCWGANSAGQAGNNSVANAVIPTAARWPDAPVGVTATLTPQTVTSVGAPAGSVAPIVTVKATDAFGTALQGVTVNWAVIGANGTISPSSSLTDVNGNASTTTWTLTGTVGASNVLEAQIAGVPSGVFTGTVTPTPGAITISGGDQQYAPSQFPFPQQLSVLVKDGSNNPIAGASVLFSVASGTNVSFSSASQILNWTATTNASGIASVAPFTWGSTIGASTVTATAQGIAPVTFTLKSSGFYDGQARCELTSTGASYCWGQNNHGQIGDGTTSNRPVPTATTGGLAFASLAEGSADHMCGLTAAGVAYCWGSNFYGQIGDGTTVDKSAPTLVAGAPAFASIAVGITASCGLTPGGVLYCWGWTGYGLFGDGVTGILRTTPTAVTAAGTLFSKVALGPQSACAISTVNAMYCWGLNGNGQIGDNTFVSKSVVTALGDGRAYASVSVGAYYACGVTTAGAGYCWGNNQSGVLGDGTTTTHPVPTAVTGGLTFSTIRTSLNFTTCGLTTAGAAYCWGANGNSLIGDGTAGGTHIAPTAVVGGLSFGSINIKTNNVCARLSTGNLQPFCWGFGGSGQNGNGLSSNSAIPTAATWVEGSAGTAVSVGFSGPASYTATAGNAVGPAPAVLVRDYLNNPVQGVTVNFVVTQGGGSVVGGTATTNASGIAQVTSWTLGSTPGANSLTATVAGVGNVLFTATGN